jgi:hypothetical protein
LDETDLGLPSIGVGTDKISGEALGSKKEMHVQNTMVATSAGSGLLGLLAQIEPPLAAQDMPKLNMMMLIFSAIPLATLVVRAAYCAYLRRLAHMEILAMISANQLPPTLAQKIIDDASKISPETAVINPQPAPALQPVKP